MSQKITASVGEGTSNKTHDVAIVQALLLNILPEAGGNPDLGVDGIYGSGTQKAINHFQDTQFGFADGVIRPGEITFQRMNDMFQFRWEKTNPYLPVYIKHTALVRSGLLPDMGFLGDPPYRPSADSEGWVLQLAGVDGNIYYHPAIGAFLVRGLIWGAYVGAGEEGGQLGYPVSDERDWVSGGGRISYFQYGRITYTQASGAVVEMAPGT